MPIMRAPGWIRKASWHTALAALVAGGIIHILATLVVPRLAPASTFQRLTQSLQMNRMYVLPQATRDTQVVPFLEADLRLAVCRYDVTDGPISLSVTLPEKGWSLALYSSQGDNFFVLPAQEMRRSNLSLTLVPPPEKLFGLFNWGRTANTTATEIQVPAPRGLIVVRAPLRSRSHAAEIDSVLQKAQCGQAPRTS